MKNDKQNDKRWVEAQKIALNLSGFKNLPSKSYKPLSKQGGKSPADPVNRARFLLSWLSETRTDNLIYHVSKSFSE